MHPLLSVITVTWNGRRYVDECVRSLNQASEIPSEVIVVDNNSSDGTPELIESSFPNFTVIRNASNLGFSKANNIGIAMSCGRYLCLINSDVVLPPHCLDRLFRFMEANPEVAVSGPQLRGPNDEIRRSSMRLPTLTNAFCRAIALDRIPFLSKLLGGQMMSDFQHDATADVEVLNGWFWVIRREALGQVGLLDERFFMYGEDMDWCLRFRDAGWRVVLVADACALHYGGASSSVAPVRFYIEMHRANLQYWQKHHGRAKTVMYAAILLVHHLVRLVGHSLAYLAFAGRRTQLAGKIKRNSALMGFLIGIHTALP